MTNTDRAPPNNAPMRPWNELSATERLALREAFGYAQDRLPRTCDMDEKIRRFRRWLADRGIAFDAGP